MADEEDEDDYSGDEGPGGNVDRRMGNQNTDRVYDVDLAKKRLDEARSRYLRFFNANGQARREGPLIKDVVTYTGHNVRGRDQNTAPRKEGYSDNTIYRIRSLLQRAIIKRFRAWKALQAGRGVEHKPFKPYVHPTEVAKDGKVRKNVRQQSRFEEASRSFLANAKMQMPELSHRKQPGGNLSFDAILHLKPNARMSGERFVEKADVDALTGSGLKKTQVGTASRQELLKHLSDAHAVFMPEESDKILRARVIKHLAVKAKRREQAAERARQQAAEDDDDADADEELEEFDGGEEDEEAEAPPPPADTDKKKLRELTLQAETLFGNLNEQFKLVFVAAFNQYVSEENTDRMNELLAFNDTKTVRFEDPKSDSNELSGSMTREHKDAALNEFVYRFVEFSEQTLKDSIGVLELLTQKQEKQDAASQKKPSEKPKEAKPAKPKPTKPKPQEAASALGYMPQLSKAERDEAKKAKAEELERQKREDREFRKQEQAERRKAEERAAEINKAVKMQQAEALAKWKEEQRQLIAIKQGAMKAAQAKQRRREARISPEIAAAASLKMTKEKLQEIKDPVKKRAFLGKLKERLLDSFLKSGAEEKEEATREFAKPEYALGVWRDYKADAPDPDKFYKLVNKFFTFNNNFGLGDSIFASARNRIPYEDFFEHEGFKEKAEGSGKPTSFFIAKLLAETSRYNHIRNITPRYKPIPDDEPEPTPPQSTTYLNKAFIDKVKDFKRRQRLYRVLGDPRFPPNMGTKFELNTLLPSAEKKRKLKETNASGYRWFQGMKGSGMSNYGLLSARNSSGEDSDPDEEGVAKRRRGGFEVD